MAKKEKKGLVYKLLGMSTLKMGFEHTKDMLKSATHKDPNNYINETFDEAFERLGIPPEKRDQHAINVYKTLKISFIIMTTAVLIFLIFGVARNFYYGNHLSAFLYISLSFAFLSVIANNSFRCFQIRRRELGGLKDWFRNPKEWYPYALKNYWNKTN